MVYCPMVLRLCLINPKIHQRNMNRRMLLFVVGLLTLVGSGIFLLWPSKPAPFSLKIIRQAVEKGKPVVYFRVEGGSSGRIQISSIQRVVNDAETATPRPAEPLWPSWQWYEPRAVQTEFAIPAPAIGSSWRLRLWVHTEISTGRRLQTMPTRCWKMAKDSNVSFFKAARVTWDDFVAGGAWMIESDPITNSMQTSP
jgi:hypothetical protein